MKKFILIFIVAISTLSFVQDQEWPTSSSTTGKYSVQHPEGWIADFQDGNTVFEVYEPTDSLDGLSISVTLSQEEQLLEEVTLAQFAGKQKMMISEFLKIEVIDGGEKTLAGLPAIFTQYKYTENLQKLQSVSIFAIKNKTGYQLTMTAPEFEFNQRLPLLNKIAESLTIN